MVAEEICFFVSMLKLHSMVYYAQLTHYFVTQSIQAFSLLPPFAKGD